ncbi:hypothetical protein HK104_000773 [Borealophlyctis nickersoniae]|nr:hypothetical protein HK104_000773 [Borealophlyctis nickersoniae]
MPVAVEDYDAESPVNTGFGLPAPTAPCPEYRPEEIHNIVETVDRYNPQNIPTLEGYVKQQMQTGTYDRDACLAVLKLYQFNPTYTNIANIANILSLALAALPDPDFNLALYMLNEEIISDPTIARLCRIQQLLEQARFQDFWSALNGEDEEDDDSDVRARDLLVDFPTFDARIRDFIGETVRIAYQTIGLKRLGEFLKLEGAELKAWLEGKGWDLDATDSELVNLPVTKENQAKPQVVQENIKFEQLTKIIGYGRLTQ